MSLPANLPSDLLAITSREPLLNLFRQLTLAHDELGREIVINMLLRNYIHHKHFDLADKLISSVYDESQAHHRSTNQSARFFYYVAVVKAIKLDYSEAGSCIAQALRKAPEKALGFRTIATKLSLVIQLLSGVIPQRSEFRAKDMRLALQPYLFLTACVRFGELRRFHVVLSQYSAAFTKDSTLSLVHRIRHNVIKMALRRVCQSYTRISLADICAKLTLETANDAEYIVTKAIRDGVIDAHVDHENGWVISREVANVYATTEPALTFQKRIAFCNLTHNEARRAMKYGTQGLEDDEERKKKMEQETKELVKALEEGVDPDDEGDF
jgi:26S proteasome regulatory subunit N3